MSSLKRSKWYMTWSGVALVAAGATTLVVNAGLTPLLRSDAPYATTAASTAFLWRQSFSALAALLLLSGSIGLYLRHDDRLGRFGAIAFVLALAGSTLLFAHEWSQVFFVRGLALAAPDILEELDATRALSLYDVGAIIALLTFTLGWILFSVSMLLRGVYARLGPILVIVGLFAAPFLSAALPFPWGAIAGSAVLGTGWMILGWRLLSHDDPRVPVQMNRSEKQ
jgi:hypothetical protein